MILLSFGLGEFVLWPRTNHDWVLFLFPWEEHFREEQIELGKKNERMWKCGRSMIGGGYSRSGGFGHDWNPRTGRRKSGRNAS